MGTVIFVLLRAFKVFDTDLDWMYGSMLVSLDSIAIALFSLGSTLRSCLNPEGECGRKEVPTGSDDETKTES